MVVLAAMVGTTALATLSQGLALGIVGLSLVLLVGFAGQVSLCQLTFMGIGAFTMGKTLGGDSWWGLLLAVAVSGAVGALVALPTLRLRGLYLALATLRLRRRHVLRLLRQLERDLRRRPRSPWGGCGCPS